MTTSQIDIASLSDRAKAIWARLYILQDGGSSVKVSYGSLGKYLGISEPTVARHHKTLTDRGIVTVTKSQPKYLREVKATPPPEAYDALHKILKDKKDMEEREARAYKHWINYRTEWAKAKKAAIRRASHEVAKEFNDDLAELKRENFESWWEHYGRQGITRYTATEVRELIESCIYDGYDGWDRVKDGYVLIPHQTQGGGLMVHVG